MTKEELRVRVKALEAAAEKQREELAALSREVDEPAVEASSVTQVKKLMTEVCAHIGWSDGRVHIAMAEWNALWNAIADLPDEDHDTQSEAGETLHRVLADVKCIFHSEFNGAWQVRIEEALLAWRKAHS